MELHIDIRLAGSGRPNATEQKQIDSLLAELRTYAIAPIVGSEAGQGHADVFLRIKAAAQKSSITAVRGLLSRSAFAESSSLTVLRKSRKTVGIVRLPRPGEAFAFPVFGKRFGCCRVLRGPTAEEEVFFGGAHVLISISPWVGDRIPPPSLPELRDTLVLTHHSHTGREDRFWTWHALPNSYQFVGIIEPTSVESSVECGVHGGWACAIDVEAQHLWDEDQKRANQSLQRNASTMSSSTIKSAVRHG
ncbi:MAG TPA: hypothetical protein DCQ04_05560 [Actinobacteria bacterium]|nr:hypothetical protein [Actinomycetota bacterium]